MFGCDVTTTSNLVIFFYLPALPGNFFILLSQQVSLTQRCTQITFQRKGFKSPMFAFEPTPNPLSCLFHQIYAQLKLNIETVFFVINSDKIYSVLSFKLCALLWVALLMDSYQVDQSHSRSSEPLPATSLTNQQTTQLL